MKKTIISAIALAAVSMAGAQTVRNLVVTDLDGKTTQIPADQIDAVVFQEVPDYVAMTHVLNTSYEESGENSGLYIVELGTSEPDQNGEPLEIGDMQIALLLKATASQDLLEPKLPAGYYRVGNSTVDYTFDINRSVVWVRAESGSEGVAPQVIIDGTVDVREEPNGVYDIRMELVTIAGNVNLRYQGQLPFPPGVSEFDTFTEPLDLTFTHGQGRFYGNWYYPFAADLTAQFFVGTISGDALTDGYILSMPIYEPKPEDCMAPGQRIADGTYSVETREEIEYTYLPYRYMPGKYVDMWGQTYMSGSYLTYISPTGHRKFGFITSGTMTVSENGTVFDFDFTTPEGVSIKGKYNGTPNIVNYCDNNEKEPPRPYSTLDSNVVLNWDPETVAISYNDGHNIIDTANDFMVMFTTPTQDKGDYILLDLFCEEDKLADGTYTIDSTLAAGHGIPGTIDFGGMMLFSWYGDLGLVDDEGYNTKLGPIASGTVEVSTVAGGQRKFVFNLKDDKGNDITGEYTGTLIDANEMNSMAKKLTKGKERKIRRAPVRTRR